MAGLARYCMMPWIYAYSNNDFISLQDFAVHEEKLNYLRAHVTEVNRRAVALMESSDKVRYRVKVTLYTGYITELLTNTCKLQFIYVKAGIHLGYITV